MKAFDFLPSLSAILSEQKALMVCEECPSTYILAQKVKNGNFATPLTNREKQRLQAAYTFGGYLSCCVEEEEKKVIRSSAQIAKDFLYLSSLNHEEFWAVYLNRANLQVDKVRISSGGINNSVVDSRIVFRKALECSASGMVFVHNHPSGNVKPSKMDMQLTKSLCEGAKLLDMQVLDHVIIGDSGAYFSFADDGLIEG